jgi:hypothetical protein
LAFNDVSKFPFARPGLAWTNTFSGGFYEKRNLLFGLTTPTPRNSGWSLRKKRATRRKLLWQALRACHGGSVSKRLILHGLQGRPAVKNFLFRPFQEKFAKNLFF